MREHDYIKASELARARAAMEVLRHVVPGNVATVTRISEERAESEWRYIMRALDSWIARLERVVASREEPRDAEEDAARSEWPERWLRAAAEEIASESDVDLGGALYVDRYVEIIRKHRDGKA